MSVRLVPVLHTVSAIDLRANPLPVSIRLSSAAPRKAHGKQQGNAAHFSEEHCGDNSEPHQQGEPWICQAFDTLSGVFLGEDSNVGDAGKNQEQHAA
ncbi:hypothetical protein [Ralstonia syzygii]|uniref:Uncharacterized protein n=1 Tax=Ralstonia syzygii R24 TaxID=907261 RepID=G3A7V9_9RALS|nr:hypothetical protein [Ralstonia syzygii]CCA86595.1 hypothetical protein RALSY_40825 [Ralstonia syzygii R24]